MRNLNLVIKRIFDILGSGICLILISPLLILTSLLIEIFMPGPIFFKQQRVGKNGKLFNIIKFRSMIVDKAAEMNHDFSKDNARLKPLGKVIRRLKIDELPQLINVLKGEMSLVGPRPTIKEQVDQYTEMQMHRLDVRPGMTGLAQVNGNIFIEWDERIKYDLEYVKNISVYLDLKILLKTMKVIVFGEKKFAEKRK